MRDRYETPEQRMAADLIANEVAGKLGVVAVPQDDTAPVNYALVRGATVMGGLEVRTRNVGATQYDTTIVSARRLTATAERAKQRGVPFFIAIRYLDGLYVFDSRDLTGREVKTKRGGRRDRGDPADVEVVAHLPMEWSRPLARVNPL